MIRISRKNIPRKWAVPLIVAFLILMAGSMWSYRSEKVAAFQQAQQNYTALAQAKLDQITTWRRTQLDYAALISKNRLLAEFIMAFPARANDKAAQKLKAFFRSIATVGRYTDVVLTDADGMPLLSLSGNLETDKVYVTALAATIGNREPAFTELYLDERSQSPHLIVAAPIVGGDKETESTLGAILLVNDASQVLYPLIEKWPTASKTAEIYLSRRDGDDLLFLSNLKKQPNAALKKRLPLSRTDILAVMGVLGRQGFVQGKDYDEQNCVAVLQPVPGSEWHLVTKEDTSEVLALWRFRSALMLTILAGLAGGVAAVVLIVSQHSRGDHFEHMYHTEATLRASIERHSVTLKSIRDGVIATDSQGRVEILNPAAETLTGWSDSEARGRPLKEVLHIINEKTREIAEDPLDRVLRQGLSLGLIEGTSLIAKNGIERPIGDAASTLRNEKGDVSGVVLVIRDLTEQRRVQRLTEVRLSLLEYASDHNLDEFLSEALDQIGALVDSPIGFYDFVDSDKNTVSLQQCSRRTLREFCRAEGKGMQYSLEQAGVWADAVRQGKPVIHNDYASLPHKKGLPAGHAQVVRELVVPVMKKGKVVAALAVGNKPLDYTATDVETAAYLADVTWHIVENKRNQEALIDSEKRYRRLFETSMDGILILDAETGRVLDANPFMIRLFNYSTDELRGKIFWEIGLFKNIAADQNGFEVLQDQDYYHLDDISVENRGGQPIPVDFSSTAYMVDHTKVIKCNFRDISARKRFEAEREKLLAAIGQAGEAFVITDPMGVIEYVNPVFETVTGYSRSEAIGQTPRILKSGEQNEAFYRELWETISNGRIWRGRFINKRKDGTRFTETATISPVCDAGGKIVNYIAVKRDITEHLRLEAQFQQAQKMESVGRLAGGVAHDFNNMLSIILGYMDLAMEKLPAGDPLGADLEEIRKAANRSRDITRQLLAFARKQTIEPRVLGLNNTVEGMLKMLQRLIGEDIDLAWLPGADLWPIKMDPSQLDQVLANLCVNARDAISGVGKVTIETRNAVFDEAYCADHAGFIPGQFVMLAVSDDGCGMDKETLEKIFEPFFTTKGVERGTGLGLATVYGIVKQNDGFINVYSEPGKGTTFRIYLPGHEHHALESIEKRPLEISLGQGETVLLVEDDRSIMKMTQAMLKRLGYNVLTAGTPSEAISLSERHPEKIHLLMTDVIMPEMNGRDLADRLHALYPDIKTLFMSGYTANVIAHHGVLHKGVHFIQKPFSLQDLAVKTRTALDKN